MKTRLQAQQINKCLKLNNPLANLPVNEPVERSTSLTAFFPFFWSQHDRLKMLLAELEEKLEASEIQIKQQSAEYRSLLQQKDVCLFVFAELK